MQPAFRHATDISPRTTTYRLCETNPRQELRRFEDGGASRVTSEVSNAALDNCIGTADDSVLSDAVAYTSSITVLVNRTFVGPAPRVDWLVTNCITFWTDQHQF
jgi:hypothetical protein